MSHQPINSSIDTFTHFQGGQNLFCQQLASGNKENIQLFPPNISPVHQNLYCEDTCDSESEMQKKDPKESYVTQEQLQQTLKNFLAPIQNELKQITKKLQSVQSRVSDMEKFLFKTLQYSYESSNETSKSRLKLSNTSIQILQKKLKRQRSQQRLNQEQQYNKMRAQLLNHAPFQKQIDFYRKNWLKINQYLKLMISKLIRPLKIQLTYQQFVYIGGLIFSYMYSKKSSQLNQGKKFAILFFILKAAFKKTINYMNESVSEIVKKSIIKYQKEMNEQSLSWKEQWDFIIVCLEKHANKLNWEYKIQKNDSFYFLVGLFMICISQIKSEEPSIVFSAFFNNLNNLRNIKYVIQKVHSQQQRSKIEKITNKIKVLSKIYLKSPISQWNEI